jgi:hypothetical protein
VAAFASRRSWLIAAVAVGLVIALLVGGRGAMRLYFRLHGPPPPPRQTDVSAIADWMTVPYVARSYRVPETELYGALGIGRQGQRTNTLADIASETGRSSDETVEIVRTTVAAWQAEHRGPPGRTEPPDPNGSPPSPTGAQLAPSRLRRA